MVSVFLSYDREDAGRARPIALALEQAGHSVWWDLHVRSGAQFGKVIEEALQAAEAVVVLWSRHAIESAWVRDEAAAGRDTGRLVPVTIDGTKPPLGFRQFQTIDFSDWKGRRKSAQLQTLLHDIAELAAGPSRPFQKASSGEPVAAQRKLRSSRLTFAAVGVLLITTAGVIAWQVIERSHGVPVIAVAAADSSTASQSLARDLLIKLGSLQTSDTHSIDLVGTAQSRRRPTLIVQVGGASNGQTAYANLALMNPRASSLIWAKDFPQSKAADLKEQLAYTAAQALRCGLDGLDPQTGRLSGQTLKNYVAACATMSDPIGGDVLGTISTLREIVQEKPHFRGAWAKLLLAEIAGATELVGPDASNAREALRQDVVAGRRANPELPEAYIADFVLTPDTQFLDRSTLLDRGVERNPHNAELRNVRSIFLASVGRLNDAVMDARRATELDPLSPALRDEYISLLAFAGRREEAFAELRKADRLWPGASSLLRARYLLELRGGDPRQALRLLHAGALKDADTSWIDLQQTFLQARIERSPEKIEEAIKEAARAYKHAPYAIGLYSQTLAEFGRDEELIELLLSWRGMEVVNELTEVLFRPTFNEVQADPRFMRVAQHLGLLDYWRKTGEWPDFCSRRDLRYDCTQEAAKLAG